MKTFQKIILASAISAAPFASQAMEALDDSVLAATTGQAGVTIEINIDAAGISVGEIEYKDEGSVLLQNTRITNVNNLVQTIDVDARGDVQIGMSGVTGLTVDIGDNGDGLDSAVALKSTGGNVTELVNNVHLVANLGASTVSVMNLEDRSAAELLLLPGNAGSGSVAIQMSQSIEITDLDVGVFGYTDAQAGVRATAALPTAVAGYALAYSGLTDQGGDPGIADEQLAFATANGDADNSGTINGAGEEAVVEGGLKLQYATGSAVQLNNVKFYGTGGAGTAATINQTVWAKGGTAAQGGGVYINVQSIEGTLDIGGIVLGGASIGSIKVSDLNLAGLTSRIYGH
jgi:hypothetical protein